MIYIILFTKKKKKEIKLFIIKEILTKLYSKFVIAYIIIKERRIYLLLEKLKC